MPCRRPIGSVGAQRGFTLVEVTIILLVLVILGTIMLPQLGNYNRLARYVKVKEDVGALCSSMKKMLDEVMDNAFWGDPVTQSVAIGLLFTDGAVPALDASLVAATDVNWLLPSVGASLAPQVTTDYPSQVTPPGGSFVADRFANHLLVNDPLGGGGEHYKDLTNLAFGQWAFGWHGPYFNELTSDPWGDRYMSNVFALHSHAGNVYTSAVIALSAGPNQRVDTAFDMYYRSITKGGNPGPGFAVGGDDIVCVLSAGGPF